MWDARVCFFTGSFKHVPQCADAPPMQQHARMCAQCHCCALSADLAPGTRLRARGGVAAQQAGGTRHSATPHHHPHLPATTRPRQLIRSPSNSSRLSSIGSTMDPQQIRAQQPLDSPQLHQIHHRSIQVSQGARGHFGLKKAHPQRGLVLPSRPCHVG